MRIFQTNSKQHSAQKYICSRVTFDFINYYLFRNFLTILLCVFFSGVTCAEPHKISRLFQTFYLIPTHINASSEEHTLIVGSVNDGTFAGVGGKYVVLPIVAASLGLQLAGQKVDWENLTILTSGCTAIMASQALAFNVISEPLLVPMTVENLYTKLKENKNYFQPSLEGILTFREIPISSVV